MMADKKKKVNPEATPACMSLCVCVCVFVHANISGGWPFSKELQSALRKTGKKKIFYRLSRLGKCVHRWVFVCKCASAHLSAPVSVGVNALALASEWAYRQIKVCLRASVCGCGCCLNLKPTISIFFFSRSFSLYSPKIGCTPFVTSHECLLNLLWRDLGVNLFPVEKAKLWNHEP